MQYFIPLLSVIFNIAFAETPVAAQEKEEEGVLFEQKVEVVQEQTEAVEEVKGEEVDETNTKGISNFAAQSWSFNTLIKKLENKYNLNFPLIVSYNLFWLDIMEKYRKIVQ